MKLIWLFRCELVSGLTAPIDISDSLTCNYMTLTDASDRSQKLMKQCYRLDMRLVKDCHFFQVKCT